MMEVPTVFVVDDDPETRKSLTLLLKSVGRQARVFAGAHEFLDQFDQREPGCLVLDVRLPRLGGMELHERLIEVGAEIPVIFITAYGDVPLAVRAMQRGAVDFLEKPFSANNLLARIESAIQRDAEHRQQRARREAVAHRADQLTDRQREVMALLVEGKNSKQIAVALGISPKTVDNHRAKVFSVMNVESHAELIGLAQTPAPHSGFRPPRSTNGNLPRP